MLLLASTISITVVSCGRDDDDEPEYNPPTSTLTAPTGLSGNVVSNGVLLSWNSVSAAEFYTVSRSSSLYGQKIGLGYIGQVGKIYNTNVIDTSPSEGDNYYFIQACKNLNGNSYTSSDYSSPVYVKYTNPNNPNGGGNDNPNGGGDDNPNGGGNNNQGGDNNQQKPTAPTGVTVSNEGNAYIPEVRIRWNSVTNATTYYAYKSSSANGSYSKIGDTSYAQYGYVDSNAPTNGGTAYYKVKAVNSAGESAFSDWAKYTASTNDESFAPAYTYTNCTASGTTITLNWKNSTGTGYGKATEIVLRVWNPYAEEWQDTKVNATATSASFNYSNKIDNSGYVKAGIVVSNAKGSFTAGAKVYDTKNKRFIN